MSDADGVILMYNPDSPAQDQQIVEWFEYFVKKNGLTDEQCMMFVSSKYKLSIMFPLLLHECIVGSSRKSFQYHRSLSPPAAVLSGICRINNSTVGTRCKKHV